MPDRNNTHSGFIKLRLVHAQNVSILFPDLVVVKGSGLYWLQPQWIYPSLLVLDGDGSTRLSLTVANTVGKEAFVHVDFGGKDLVASLGDHSQIYRCAIEGPQNLNVFKAGNARIRQDGGIDLRLHHHTRRSAKKEILASRSIRGSSWNYQGTQALDNCSYAYFTNLTHIATDVDLQRIAMSGTGHIPLRLDQSHDGAAPDILLNVYREKTVNRDARISLWVPAEDVAPPHVWRHEFRSVEYECAHPWIFRVGLEPGGTYAFKGNRVIPAQGGLKRFSYMIIGDCTTLSGLKAPYGEEDTDHIFQIEDLGASTVFQFWSAHGNQDLLRDDLEKQRIKES